MNVKKVLIGLSLALTIFCVVGRVLAQSGSTAASLTGRVTDESGAVIIGAVLTVKNVATNITRDIQTEEDGTFYIAQLPPGEYTITVSADGFNTESSKLSITLGTTSLVEFQLRPGQASDVIEIRANDILESKTESSTNNDRQRIDALPINRRNFLDFTLTSPRAVIDRTPAQGVAASSGLSFNGQPARFNNITIDGLENNDVASGAVRATFSQDAVQEFQIVSDSYSAEFGRALGGIVNIVTRGGGNDFHGGIFLFLRNDEIAARSALAAINPEYKQYQFGATLSGPIKRNRVFYFASFERLSIKQNNIVTIRDATVASARRLGFPLRNGPIPFAVGTTTLLARLDAQLTPNDSLNVRYNFGGTYNGAFEPFGGLTGETSAGVQELDDSTIAVNNTLIKPGLNLVNETRFLYGRRLQDVLALGEGPQPRIVAPEGLVAFGRSTFVPQIREQTIFQIVDNVTVQLGRHAIKFGGDFSYSSLPDRRSNLPVFPGGGAFFSPLDFAALSGIPGLPMLTGLQTFDPSLRTPAQRAFLTVLPALLPGFPRGLPLQDLPLPTAFVQGFGDTRLIITSKFFSAFFQEDFKATPKLLLKGGVRYDINRVSFVPTNNGNFSPRLAFSYSPVSRLNVRGSYGLFFGPTIFGPSSVVRNTSTGALKLLVVPFPFSILPFATPLRRFPESNDLPAGVQFIPQLSQFFQFQKDLRNSYSQQVSFGFDFFFAQNTVASVTYDFVRGIKIFSLRNINPVVRPLPGAGNQINSLITGRVDPTRGDVNEYSSSFDSYFNAITFSINRRFNRRFGVLAHYTFSKALDNFLDIRAEQQETQDPLLPRQERGLSLQDVRHRFVLSGTFDISSNKNILLRDYQLSSIVTLESGRPFNLLAGVDLNANGDIFAPGDRPLAIARNRGELPGFANVDVRLTRNFSIRERVRIQLIAEAFNLFNRVNINDVDRVFAPDARGNFNLPREQNGRFRATPDRFRNAFAPRQFQLGFRMNF